MQEFNINDFQWLEYFPKFETRLPETTINSDSIEFNAATMKRLGSPPSIKLLFDPDGKRIAIQGFMKQGQKNINFPPERQKTGFGIFRREKVLFVRNLMPEWDEHTRFKVRGDYHEDQNVMVFDLKTAVIFSGGSFPHAKGKTQ